MKNQKAFFAALFVSVSLISGCSSSEPVSANVEICEFRWNSVFWGFRSGITIESTDGNSHIVDVSWEVTDSGGANIYGSHTESGIRVNPSKGLLVMSETRPDAGIDINSPDFNEVQNSGEFVCRVTDLTIE
jgi:hypothetical protein